jgi:hypothetical protein
MLELAMQRSPAVPPSHVHFNGSVNLPDAETVMREIVLRVPSGLRRIPDGETGERGNWISFQLQKFLRSPFLVPVSPPDDPAAAYQMPQVRLADGVDPADVTWPDPGYADAYLRSYATFAMLRSQGVVPDGVRFQMQYPTPFASISAHIAAAQRESLLGSYAEAMFADLDRLLTAVPHDDAAVQWDVAVEFRRLETSLPDSGSRMFDAIVVSLAHCVDQVPGDIPAGLHLCYGDYGHQHFKQPESLALQVRVLNAVIAAARRPVSFVSFTVPQYRRDEAYFCPLAGLAAVPDTELNFALVPYHPADQPPGTTEEQVRLIDAALGGSRGWGICTECGMGRAGREEIAGLLDLHREIVTTG